jgi:DedD protein
MSQHMKERLTGAAVLVVLGALLIPEFLSGPPAVNATAGQELLLPAADAQPSRTHTIRPESKQAAKKPPVAQSIPDARKTVTQDKAATVNNTTGGQTTATVDPGETAAAKTATTPAMQTGGWAVQAGSFSSLDNARRLAATLESMDYASFISQTVVDGRTLHRVRIGPLASREEADRIAAELQRQGQAAKPVPNP